MATASDLNCSLLEALKKRGSGVDVTTGYPSARETNQLSLFEVLSLMENIDKRYVHLPSHQKLTHFIDQTNQLHLEALQQVTDLPDELGLREVERVFSVSFQVYLLESFMGSIRAVLVREGDVKVNVIPVVFVSGRYLRIRDLTLFQRFIYRPTANPVYADSPRLRWIKNHHHIRTLMKSQNGKQTYTDELGFFRCLAVHFQARDVEGKARQLLQKYREHYDDEDRPQTSTDPHVRTRDESFTGLNIFSELDKLERLYELKINVYRLGACHHEAEGDEEDHICPSCVRMSINDRYQDTLHLLAYEAHLCYITDIAYLSQHITCNKCKQAVYHQRMSTHYRRCRGAQTHIVFNKKTYSVGRTLAEECAIVGVQLDESLQYRPYFLVWDCETYCPRVAAHEAGEEEGEEIPIVREHDIEDTQLRSEVDNLNALMGLLLEDTASASGEVDSGNALTNAPNTQYSTPHTLLSIACASNVPGYTACRVFVTEGDSQALFDKFMNYCAEVQVAAGRQLARSVSCTIQELLRVEEKEKQDLWQDLDEALEERLQTRLRRVAGEVDDDDMDEDDGSDDEADLMYGELAFDEDGSNVEKEEGERRPPQAERSRRGQRSVSSLIGRLTSECRVLAILSYNGSAYDENVCAKYLLPYFHTNPKVRKQPAVSDDDLHRAFFPSRQKRKNKGRHGGRPKRVWSESSAEADPEVELQGDAEEGGWEDRTPPKVIKRGSRFLLLQNSRFKMLDVCHYIAAGTPYAQYIQGYDCKDEKLTFPYDFVRSLDDLEYPQLPTREQFFNSLKQKECSEEDYAKCVALWHDRGMTKFRDYLEAYNASDVVPFVEALEKQKGYFKEVHQIHLFDHVSLPSVGDRILHKKAPEGTWFSTLANRDADLHESFNRALQGGKTINYHLLSRLILFACMSIVRWIQ